jgi:hypothetical protein
MVEVTRQLYPHVATVDGAPVDPDVHLAAEPRIAGAVDFAHPARFEERNDRLRSEAGPQGSSHAVRRYP